MVPRNTRAVAIHEGEVRLELSPRLIRKLARRFEGPGDLVKLYLSRPVPVEHVEQVRRDLLSRAARGRRVPVSTEQGS